MAVNLANIVKGFVARVKGKKSKSRFSQISWLQEKRLKHEDDKKLKLIQIGKLSFCYRRPYELLHTYKELFDAEIYNFKALNNPPFIIDCGANIGVSVAYFKGIYPESNIIAFEPDADNFLILEKNIRLNNFTRVDCHKTVVWIHNDTISFAADGTQASQITTDASRNVIQIKAERLADIIKGKNVDFLKLDIEGAELDVIKDCEPYLNTVKNLFVEYHGKVSETEKLHELLGILKNNYKVYIKLAADNIRFPFIIKATKGAFDVQLNIFCYK